MYSTKNAFTIAELIIVIVILSILSAIAFVSYTSYTENARDTVRKTDIKSITDALELYAVNTGKYPEPGSKTNIMYSGAVAWKQGIVDKTVIQSLKQFSKTPLDPSTQTNYAYSITNTEIEYQIGGMYE